MFIAIGVILLILWLAGIPIEILTMICGVVAVLAFIISRFKK